MAKDKKFDVEKRLAHATLHVQELETLYKISQILSSQSSHREVLAEVLDALDSELNIKRGTITLLAPNGNDIMIEVAHGFSPKLKNKVRYRMGEGVTGQVVKTGRPMIVPRVSTEPLFLNRLKRSANTKKEISFICVPVKAGTKVLGTLSVDRDYNKYSSLDEDMRVLSIVAGMIANDVNSRRIAAAQRQELENENLRLRNELEGRFRPENIIGNSHAMQQLYQTIHQVAPSDTTVLIRGQTGTGKELIAHAIHYSSPRAGGPFVRINCAALSESLLESELFGHEKGAFTGAIQTRKGRIEEAGNGTLFLDEIGEISPATQVKLLRVLQERELERVGSNKTIKTNARIIIATNRDLEAAVAKGLFRQDLYYRINVFPIFVPPLRERKGDIVLLADYFVEMYAGKTKKDIRRISTPAINMMMAYHWPGNVRELENCIERAVLLSSDGVIHGHHLPPSLQTSEASDTIGHGSLEEKVALFERDIIIDALKRTSGNITAAAQELSTTTRILGYKVKNLNINYRHYRRKK